MPPNLTKRSDSSQRSREYSKSGSIAQPKIFTKIGVGCLIVWMIGLFVLVQLLGIYLFTPIVLNDAKMLPAERFGIGSYNGTVISYTMLLTFIVLLASIYGVVKWRIYCTQKKRTQNQQVYATHLELHQTTRHKYTVADYLAIQPFLPRIALAVLSLWVIFLIISESITYLLDKNPSAFVDSLYFTAEPKWLLILVMVIIVPIYEEFVFRGVIWSALREQLVGKRGVLLASVVTSLLFAIIHLQYDYYEMSVIFILALLFSYARYKSGSIIVPIIIHIINNGMAMWQYLYVLD